MNTWKYFIFAAALISVAESGCPSMCSCLDSAVLCMDRNLESVPSFESLENDPIIIDLSGNKINIIDNDDFSFDKSDRVKEVYLNSTELLDLDSEAFDELENLQELYLGDNLLNNIPENFIEGLPNMILLDISNNHFSGDFPKIISKSLEVLAVANSKVTSLPVDSLKYLPNLKMLLLQQNNIKSINPLVFKNVNKNAFFVRLSYNVWDCSCKNIELFEYLAGKRFIDTSDPYQCLTSTGTYLNIYRDANIEQIKKNCSNPIQVTKDLTNFKENRLLIEADEQLKEEGGKENALDIVKQDKPYSLVREDNDIPLEGGPLPSFEAQDNDFHEVLDSYNDEEQYADILVREDLDMDPKVEEEEKEDDFKKPILTKIFFEINIGTFIAILCSFVIGSVFGFCLNQFASSLRYRSLETSDSRTKLILS